jgi:hypothetical protein
MCNQTENFKEAAENFKEAAATILNRPKESYTHDDMIKQFQAGAEAEAKARNCDMGDGAIQLRNYLESVARAKPDISAKELALSIARVYLNKQLRKKYRLPRAVTDKHEECTAPTTCTCQHHPGKPK